jgi:hypothetical protein
VSRRLQATLLALVGAALILAGVLLPAAREAAIVAGVFFVLLAVGITVWDPRGGH